MDCPRHITLEHTPKYLALGKACAYADNAIMQVDKNVGGML